LPRVLSKDEQRAFLVVFNRRYWTPERDRTACLVMLDAGLRVSEACALQLDHVDLASRRITVRDGKGGLDRRVPIPPRLAAALAGDESNRSVRGRNGWLATRLEKVAATCPWLFPTRTGRSVSPDHLRRTVTKIVERTGLSEPHRISPHTLRHSFATDVLNATGNLELVRRLLGHADISTTTVYLHLADEDMEAELTAKGFRAASPTKQSGDPMAELQALRKRIAALEATLIGV